jgi:2,7-dihydroxy-5-methyl-1-naphthoate 7-O-methyltransferase
LSPDDAGHEQTLQLAGQAVGIKSEEGDMDDRWLWDVLAGTQHAAIVLAADKLRIPEAVATTSGTFDEVASYTGISKDILHRYCEHLEALGVLRLEVGQLRLSKDARLVLVPDSPGYLGPVIQAARTQLPQAVRLVEAARAGGPIEPSPYLDGHSQDLSAMHAAYITAPGMALAQSIDLKRYHHLADVGGGNGTLIQILAKHYRHLEFTLVDLPEVMELARRRLSVSGFDRRISFVAANFLDTFSLPSTPDVMMLSQILVDLARVDREKLLSNCHQALHADGMLIIQEMLMPSDGSPHATICAMSTEMVTWSRGGHLRQSELELLLQAHGFQEVLTRATWGYWYTTTAHRR